MRTLLSLLICILIVSCSSATQSSSKNTAAEGGYLVQDINAIGNVLDTQVSAWNRGSISGFMKGYWQSDSLRFIGRKGVRMGYDSVQANYQKHYPNKEKMGYLSFDDVEYHAVDAKATVYNVTGKWRIEGSDSAKGFFSLLFKKFNNDWKITVDHTW